MTFGEDASRIGEGSGPEVMAGLRNAAIGPLRSTGVTNIAETVRRDAARVDELFTKLGILKQRMTLTWARRPGMDTLAP